MRTPGGPTKGSQRSQNGLRMAPKDQYWPFLDLWDPLVGPPGVLILVYQFLLLPLDKISVKTMKICRQSELDGSKIEKIQDLGNFSHFWPFWTPFLGL